MTDIFISYKSERRAAASHLARVLRAYGYEVWFDYGLIAGTGFESQLEEKLAEAKAVVVLWCSMAVQSEWVQREAASARRDGKVIPAWIEVAELPKGFQDDHTLNLKDWDGAPRSHHLDPLLGEISRLIGRAPSTDFTTLRELDQTWRDLGAPSLAQFALGRTLKPGETNTTRAADHWKRSGDVAAKRAEYVRRISKSELRYSVPQSTVGTALPRWVSSDGALVFLKGPKLSDTDWFRVGARGGFWHERFKMGKVEIEHRVLEGSQAVEGRTQWPYALLANHEDGTLGFWDLRSGETFGRFEPRENWDKLGYPYVSRELDFVFEVSGGNMRASRGGEVMGRVPSPGPWIVDFQTFGRTRGWKSDFPLAITQSVYPSGSSRGMHSLSVYAPKRFPGVLPGPPKWRLVGHHDLPTGMTWGTTNSGDQSELGDSSYGGVLFALFDDASVISVGSDKIIKTQWDESASNASFETIDLGHRRDGESARSLFLMMSQWRNWLAFQCIDHTREMRFLQFVDVYQAKASDRFYLDSDPTADMDRLFASVLQNCEVSEGVFAELKDNEIVLRDAMSGEHLGVVKLENPAKAGVRSPYRNGAFILDMAQGSDVGRLIVRTEHTFDIYQFGIGRVLV